MRSSPSKEPLPRAAERGSDDEAPQRNAVEVTLRPSTARQELEKLRRDMPAIVDAIATMGVDCGTLTSALAHLGRTSTCVPVIK